MASLYNVTSYQIDLAGRARICRASAGCDLRRLSCLAMLHDPTQRRTLFGFATFLAWASLVQVPFSAPIYFCYVAPLAVVAAVAVGSHSAALAPSRVGGRRPVLLAFALVSMNRGYVYNLGAVHQPFVFDTPLGVEQRDSARQHRRRCVVPPGGRADSLRISATGSSSPAPMRRRCTS